MTLYWFKFELVTAHISKQWGIHDVMASCSIKQMSTNKKKEYR